MATLTVQTIDRDGYNIAFAAAAGGGDEFVNTGSEFILVKNDDASAKTLTIATPRTVDGLAVADRPVVIPAGEQWPIGPLPTSTYNDGNNKVQITYDAVTSLSLAVMKLGS